MTPPRSSPSPRAFDPRHRHPPGINRRDLLRITGLSVAGAFAVPLLSTAEPARAEPLTGAPRGTRYQFASTRLRVPDRLSTLASAGAAGLWRVSAGSPPYPIRNPRVLVPGFFCTSAGSGETERLAPDHFDVAYALEVEGVRHRARFRGKQWTQRGGSGSSHRYDTPYDWGMWSDPIPVEIPANSQLFHCSMVRIGAGLRFPASARRSPLIGDRWRIGDPAALEPLLSGGEIVTAGSSPGVVYAPMFMVAESESADPVVLIVGDSRSYFDHDLSWANTEPRSPLAAVERGLDSIGGGRVATGHVGMSGSAPAHTMIGPGLTHRVRPLLELRRQYGHLPFSHILDQHGNNGLLDWPTLTSHVTTVKEFFPGVPYVKTTIPPRVRNSTDAYRTLAGQAPVAFDSYPNGARALFNNDVLANRDDLFDAVFHAGRYGMAGDDDFHRSRFPEFNDLSGVLTRDWDGVSSTCFLSFEPRYGDRLNFDAANRARGGHVGRVTPRGDEFEVSLEIGFASGGAHPAGASFACTPTGDGTHESPRMHMIEGAAYEDMKLAGLFGPITATARPPA
ncbi:hypothetical protein [Jiangella asiatica]|uniref:Uncharacterized protein n=1 Tax=Jiangella asiatica TaxID=2530372 RepID=A0A4R5CUY0_9ACTN|nr:hypothetical protein [Jiangella asiatica]TDE02791.1 hypothetical protein E1269_21065 [Jiangella asiatica]